MKNQTDLIDRMAKLMDSIEAGTIEVDKAGAVIKAADVVVQVMKTEAAIFSASGGAMRPSFTALEQQEVGADVEQLRHELQRERALREKAERQARLGRS